MVAKNVKRVYFSILLLVLVLTSCGVYRSVSISKNYPPSVVLNNDSTRILIVNTFDFSQLVSQNSKKRGVIENGALTALNYADTRLQQLHGVRVINLLSSNMLPLTTDSLNLLVAKYHAYYTLALTGFNVDFDADNFQKTTNALGNKVQTADYSMRVSVSYVLYDQLGNAYKKLEGKLSELNSTQEASSVLLAPFFGPTIKRNGTQLQRLAVKATELAMRDVVGYTTTIDRFLYGGDPLESSVEAIKANNFSEADSLLRPKLKDTNVKLAAKAAYNLAVAYEMKGDLTNAVEMAYLSVGLNETQTGLGLLNDLKAKATAAP